MVGRIRSPGMLAGEYDVTHFQHTTTGTQSLPQSETIDFYRHLTDPPVMWENRKGVSPLLYDDCLSKPSTNPPHRSRRQWRLHWQQFVAADVPVWQAAFNAPANQPLHDSRPSHHHLHLSTNPLLLQKNGFIQRRDSRVDTEVRQRGSHPALASTCATILSHHSMATDRLKTHRVFMAGVI